jgi:hypothetical protein
MQVRGRHRIPVIHALLTVGTLVGDLILLLPQWNVVKTTSETRANTSSESVA